MKLTVEIPNLQEPINRLRGLDDKLRKKIIKDALNDGGRAIRDVAKRLAPISHDDRLLPGLLRLAQGVKLKTYPSGVTVVIVGAQTSMGRNKRTRQKQLTAFGRRKAKRAAKYGKSDKQDPAKYAHLAGPGRRQTFMTRAASAAVDEARSRIVARIERGIQEAMQGK